MIVGGDSLIGSALSNYWRNENIPAHVSTRQEEKVSNNCPLINLHEPDSFQYLDNYQSAVICAAITDMAECEKTPNKTRAVNVTATIELIKNLSAKKTHIVFLSTNQVFDGEMPMQKPDAPHGPINEYGKQKAEVENFVINIPNACILRLTKVMHPGMGLLNNWMKSLSNGKPISAFRDMTLSPISINDVIKKINSLIRQKATGIFQLSGAQDITYLEFARTFAKKHGYSPHLVKEGSWKGKLDFTPPKFMSLMNI